MNLSYPPFFNMVMLHLSILNITMFIVSIYLCFFFQFFAYFFSNNYSCMYNKD